MKRLWQNGRRAAALVLCFLMLFMQGTTFKSVYAEEVEGFGEPRIVMTTELPIGSVMDLTVAAENTVYIDWGDGNIVEYTPDGTTMGSSIKVYCTGTVYELHCGSNSLNALDISNCEELNYLYCSVNNLTELDVSNNPNLTFINCGANKLTELDVSKNTWLEILICGENEISSLDLSNQKFLFALSCDNNNLDEVFVCSEDMCDIYCGDNRLRFSTMDTRINEWSDIGGGTPEHRYSPQAEIEISAEIDVNGKVDLSSEYDINGTYTVYEWYDLEGNTVTPATDENGVFTFGEDFADKEIYCTMTNEVFPGLTLKTTTVKIIGLETEELVEPSEEPNEPIEVPDDYTGLIIGGGAAVLLVAACAVSGVIIYKKRRKAEK